MCLQLSMLECCSVSRGWTGSISLNWCHKKLLNKVKGRMNECTFIQDGELFLQKRRLSKDPVLTPVKSEVPLSDRDYFDQVG